MQPGTPLITFFVDHALWIGDVMATRHLLHCEILQGKVNSHEIQ